MIEAAAFTGVGEDQLAIMIAQVDRRLGEAVDDGRALCAGLWKAGLTVLLISPH